MTLKLHNSFSKDPYTKQLWLRFGQLSLILDRLTHNKYRATHYSACLKTSLSWVTQLLTYFVYNVYHPVDKETKGKSIRCWLLIQQECVIGNFSTLTNTELCWNGQLKSRQSSYQFNETLRKHFEDKFCNLFPSFTVVWQKGFVWAKWFVQLTWNAAEMGESEKVLCWMNRPNKTIEKRLLCFQHK